MELIIAEAALNGLIIALIVSRLFRTFWPASIALCIIVSMVHFVIRNLFLAA